MKLIGRALIGDTSCHGEIVGDQFHVITGDIFGTYQVAGPSIPMAEVVLGTPITGTRYFNIMGGFRKPEVQGPPDHPPMWMPKATNFPSGDGAEIQVPGVLTGPVQIESELAVVVGSPLRKASPEAARAAIFGWTVFNDITAPEYGANGYWVVAKSVDGFTSWGPWVRVDLSEERVMSGLAITARVNGVEVQSGNTRYFKFRPSEVLSHISHLISLSPGDVVALGTPPPAVEVSVGDHSECEVEEIGVLNNYLVPESPEPPSAIPRAQAWSKAVVA